MAGKPVVKNNGRRNAEGKYHQQERCRCFFYVNVVKQYSFFATMLQIYVF